MKRCARCSKPIKGRRLGMSLDGKPVHRTCVTVAESKFGEKGAVTRAAMTKRERWDVVRDAQAAEKGAPTANLRNLRNPKISGAIAAAVSF